MLLLVACAADPLHEVRDFGENPGALRMFERAPEGEGPAPLLLVLHGCLQDHHLASDGGFDALAPDAVLIAAEQVLTNNVEACFNWFLPGDSARDGGEVASLAAMIASAQARYDVDPARIGVVGLSAGAAMANALLAAWPDVVTAGVVVAGAPVGCADTVASAATCLTDPGARTDEEWADEVRERSDGPWPRVMVVQGEADVVVAPAVSDAIVAQWAGVHGLATEGGVVTTFESAEGAIVSTTLGAGEVVSLRYEGVGHTFPVDPDAGCGEAGTFLLDLDDCLAARALAFLAGG